MASPSNFTGGVNSDLNSPVDPPTEPNSDFVVILAALLCALICTVGLFAVARCAWIRRSSSTNRSPTRIPANKGLKKNVIRSIPKLTFNCAVNGKLADCAICLTEFVDGDEIRILPQCGHGFHIGCIDMWLGSHSSCPSCRQILVARCEKCGGFPSSSDTVDLEIGLKSREDDSNRFLP